MSSTHPTRTVAGRSGPVGATTHPLARQHWLRHPLAAVLCSALLLVLAAPPLDLWPLALVALVPLYLHIRDAAPWRAAGYAWLTGLLALLGVSGWWVQVLADYAALPLPLALLVALLGCGYQALIFALWAGGARWLVRRHRLHWLLVGPLLIVLAEAAVPFFFRWHVGVLLWRAWPLIQIAELGGLPAVSALLVALNLLLAEGLLRLLARQPFGAGLRWAAVALGLVVALGWARALAIQAAQHSAPSLRVGIVQPNNGPISLAERERTGDTIVRGLRQSTASLAARGIDLVVWPESSWPYLLSRDLRQDYPAEHPWRLRPAGYQGRLLVGAETHQFGRDAFVYNSAVLVGQAGQIAGMTDKQVLIPFAEAVPLAARFPEWAAAVRKRLPEWPTIQPGAAPTVLVDRDLRVGVLLCSEELDLAQSHAVARLHPNLLVTLANGGWFGASGATAQQRALAVFRAVETRRMLVRATTTGVSGVIDATGRVAAEAGRPPEIGTPTLLEAQVPLLEAAALGPVTARFFPLFCLGLVLGLLAGQRRNKRR